MLDSTNETNEVSKTVDGTQSPISNSGAVSKGLSVLNGIFALFAFAVVGIFTGWLVGASEAPTIAALLPLVFALLASLGFGYAESLTQAKKLNELLTKPDTEIVKSVREAIAKPPAQTASMPAFWSVGIMVFCAACYLGIQRGLALRVPHYRSIESLTRGHTLSPDAQAELIKLKISLRKKNVSEEEFNELYSSVVAPILQDKNYAPGGAYNDALPEKLASLAKSLNAITENKAGGRGPASENAP